MSDPAAQPDLLVVGGGPAGLAVAIRACRAGLAATVVERFRPPVDKACGEGLMPDGVEALAELGVDPVSLGGRPFRGIRYVDAAGDAPPAAGDFPAPAGGRRWGLGVRRTRLHAALAERALAVGVELRWGVSVRGLERRGAGWVLVTDRGQLAGRWLVAADGLRSRLRRWAGLAGPPPRRRRFGVRRHFALAPWGDRVEVHWADGCEAYVTPVGEREVGVAMLWTESPRGLGKQSFDALLERFPALAGRLAGATELSRDRGAGPLAERPRALVSDNLALVGDAAGYLDAITGEGLSLAFHQAAALVPALRAGDPAAYVAAHRRLTRLPEALIRLLLAVERRPALRRRMISALAADPALFARLLAVHARSLPLSGFGLGGAARLAWRLATA